MIKSKKKIIPLLFTIAAVFMAAGLFCIQPESKKFSRADEPAGEAIDLYDYNKMHWELATRIPVEGTEAEDGQWEYQVQGTNSKLGSDIYVYTYTNAGEETENGAAPTVYYYYSASELWHAPESAWGNWKFARRINALESAVTWNGAEQYIAVAVPFHEKEIEDDEGNVTDVIKVPHYTVTYSGNAGTDAFTKDSCFRATATLTAENGYYFAEGEPDEAFASRGVSITIGNEGKTATVTKNWYIVNKVNRVFSPVAVTPDQPEPYRDYSVPNWTFGSIASVPMPYLAYGDERYLDPEVQEQQESYEAKYYYLNEENNVWQDQSIVSKAGGVYTVSAEGWLDLADPKADAKDFLTFTLKKGNETICTDANRSQWGYYLNKYTPVGKYTVSVKVEHLSTSGAIPWWLGGQTPDSGTPIYQGFTREYEFEVTPAEFDVDLTGVKESPVNLADLQKNGFEGTVNGIFALTGIQTTEGAFITESDLKANGGYWADKADELYEFEPSLAFNLADFMSDEYYELGADIWEQHVSLTEPKSYTVFYKAIMKNYVWNVDLPAEKYDHALILNVYRELEAPELANDGKITYTGKELSPEFTNGSPEYLSKFTVKTNQTVLNAQEYELTCTLLDPVHYKWAGKELGEAEKEIPLFVETAKITVPVLAHKPYTGEPLVPDELKNIPTGANGKPLYELVDDIPQNWINAATYDIDIRLTDSENYDWVDVNGTLTGTPAEIQIKFVIDPAKDGWKASFRIQPWEYGAFQVESNFFGGVTELGAQVFYSVAYDSEGEKLCKDLEEFREGNTFPASAMFALAKGTYYIRAYTKGDGNVGKLNGEWTEFEVKLAKNDWVQHPHVNEWKWREYNGAIHTIETGAPRFGDDEKKVLFYRLDEGGNRVGEGKNNLDEFKENGTSGIEGVPAGKYEMVVSVPENENYAGISDTIVRFTIGKAQNAWEVTPAIQSWVFGNLPEALGNAKYGEIEIEITASNGETLYKGALKGLSERDELRKATPDNYTFTAQVPVSGNYTGLTYSGSFRVHATDANRWIVAPSIESWTAGETASTPRYEAAINNGAATHWYENEEGEYLGDRAPEAAGEYYLVVRVPGTQDGVDLLETRVAFCVKARPILTNVWEIAPNIQGWKKGETPNEPVGKPQAGTATFAYKTANGEALGATPPSEAGDYILTVTAKAEGYAELVAEVRFTISPVPVSVTKTAQDNSGNPVYLTIDGVAEGTAAELEEIANAGDSAGFFKRTKNTLAGMGYGLGAIYEITLTDANGAAVQPNGTVTVTVSVPKWLQNKSGLQIAYINERGEAELMGGAVSGENITFTTDHFSTYCFVWSEGSGSAAKTGWAIFLTVIVELCVAAAVATSVAVFVIVSKRKKAAEITTAQCGEASESAAEEPALPQEEQSDRTPEE